MSNSSRKRLPFEPTSVPDLQDAAVQTELKQAELSCAERVRGE